ncbi:MAG: hypothetical protein ACR2PU_04710 [Gammaproteobacteria bacterium]
MKYTFLTFIIFLFGCATSTPTHLPDGSAGFSIDCSGGDLTWGDCDVKAGEVCHDKGYTVISKDSDTSASASGDYASTDVSRTMLIKCGSK